MTVSEFIVGCIERAAPSPRRRRWVCATIASGLCTAALGAQQADSARTGVRPAPVTQRPVQRRDSLQPPISPRRAFLYSLAIPGLGQSKLQRPSAGALYIGFELTAIAMLSKSAYDLRVAKRRVRDVVINSYQLGPDGSPIFDDDGRPVPKDTVPNRYAADAELQERSRLKARRLHYEDWVTMLFFTHLFSGADAFVSAHLWDLPQQLDVRRLPDGRTGVGARIRFR